MHQSLPRGRSAEFTDFYAAHFDKVFQLAWAFSGDAELAKDAAQDAFARAFVRWSRVSNHPLPDGWVIMTALNLCRRGARRSRREVRHDHDVAVAAASPTERVDVLRAVRALPPKRRTAVLLYYLADMTISGVANAMGLSEGAVKAHLHHARTNLGFELREGYGVE